MDSQVADDLLNLFKHFGGSNGLAISAAIGLSGWLGQKYFSFATEWLTLNIRGIRCAKILSSEIEGTAKNFEKEFSVVKEAEMLAEAERKHHAWTKAPKYFLLASTSTPALVEQLKKGIIELPSGVTLTALSYFTSEELFDKCYDLLGTKDFAESDMETKKQCVKDCCAEARNCVANGYKAARQLEFRAFELQIYVMLFVSANLFVGYKLMSIVSHVFAK